MSVIPDDNPISHQFLILSHVSNVSNISDNICLTNLADNFKINKFIDDNDIVADKLSVSMTIPLV